MYTTCEILDTSPQPWLPTCTAMLTQKSSSCLINLDSSVFEQCRHISRYLWCFRHKVTLSRWREKKNPKHFPASESSFFNKYSCEMLQRNKTYLLLIAKLIHLATLSLQASGGRLYFQTYIQFTQFPIQNHCPGAFVTYYFCFTVFFLASAFYKV